MRKISLARLARRPDGILAAPFEQGEIGPELFRAACDMGLEGMVSKRADRPYRAGRSRMSRTGTIRLIGARRIGSRRVGAFLRLPRPTLRP